VPSLSPSVMLAGAIVGFAVGLTGMGGGALMTPILVVVLGVQPGAAVSSDLVASLFMKPVGGAVHLRRRTVDFRLVGWLALGSVPAAFLGAWTLNASASGHELQHDIQLALGAALALAVVGIGVKVLLDRHRGQPSNDERPPLRRLATLAIGVVGGFIVGMTSVGSGTLIIVALMFLYPGLTSRRLVGTDLVQAVPLVGAAALGQALFGHVSIGLTLSLLLGSIPAVYLGARISAGASTMRLRPVLAGVLLLSSLKLLGVSNDALGVALGIVVVALVVGTVAAIRRRPPAPDTAPGASTRKPTPAGPASVPPVTVSH
jgi:uncharacterized protein